MSLGRYEKEKEISEGTHGIYNHALATNKGKIFYGHKPPSGESTTTECMENYQLLAVITVVVQWGTPSYSRPQPATDNVVRDGRFN